jgi:hypothetical protein
MGEPGGGVVALLLLLMLLQAVKKALKISMSASDTTTFGEFMGPLVADIVWLWRVSVIRKVDL